MLANRACANDVRLIVELVDRQVGRQGHVCICRQEYWWSRLAGCQVNLIASDCSDCTDES